MAVGSELTSAPDLPLPASSVPVVRTLQTPGSSTFAHEFGSDGDFFSGLSVLAPGESTEIAIGYTLPSSVITQTDEGFVYELALVAQPGASGRAVTVTVRMPTGSHITRTNIPAQTVDTASVTFAVNLESDINLMLELEAN